MSGRKGSKGERMRLFVAAYPDREWVAAARALVEGLELPEHRLVPADQVHLTLHFIGPAERRELDQIRESVERSCAGLEAFELKPTRLVALPEQRARLIAVEMDLPATLVEMHERLVQRLAGKRSRRAYLPHITVCRFARAGSAERSSRSWGGLDAGVIGLGSFWVRRVFLMRSRISERGAEHWLVGQVDLA